MTLGISLIVVLLGYLGYYVWQKKASSVTVVGEVVNIVNKPKAAHTNSQPAQAMQLSKPLEVFVNGRKYPLDIVRARDGWVTLSSKEELGKFPEMLLKINLTNANIKDFSNQNLQFHGTGFSDPNIQVSWMVAGENLPKSEFIMNNYDLQLKFGQERDYRIPMQLKFESKGKVAVKAVGKFVAKTSDLVVVNGQVDLHHDNSDTVMYVIEQFIKRTDNVTNLKSLDSQSHSMSMPGKEEKKDPNPQRVYSSSTVNLEFESIQGKEVAEFQMVRVNNGWQVYRVLKPERLQASTKVDQGLDTLFIFGYFGKQVVEKRFGKDKLRKWERKGSMLQHRHPDPKKDQTQKGSASYLVHLKDGRQRYVKIMAVKEGVWKIKKVLDGSQVAQAHAAKPYGNKVRGSDITKYLSAKRLERALNNRYPDLQIRSVNFSCGYSALLTQCRISWQRLVNNEEKCEGTKYMYRRKDKNAAWKFVKELAADEELDHRDGLVKKKKKPRKYSCW